MWEERKKWASGPFEVLFFLIRGFENGRIKFRKKRVWKLRERSIGTIFFFCLFFVPVPASNRAERRSLWGVVGSLSPFICFAVECAWDVLNSLGFQNSHAIDLGDVGTCPRSSCGMHRVRRSVHESMLVTLGGTEARKLGEELGGEGAGVRPRCTEASFGTPIVTLEQLEKVEKMRQKGSRNKVESDWTQS